MTNLTQTVGLAEDDAPLWTGEVELASTEIAAAGLASPVRIESGNLRLKGGDASLTIHRGSLAGTTFSAVYERPASERRPQRLRLELPVLTIQQVDSALAPTLGRRQGFLARTLRLGVAPAPEWLIPRGWLVILVNGIAKLYFQRPKATIQQQIGVAQPRHDLREISRRDRWGWSRR